MCEEEQDPTSMPMRKDEEEVKTTKKDEDENNRKQIESDEKQLDVNEDEVGQDAQGLSSTCVLPFVAHVQLLEGERRGWWKDHELPSSEMIQAFVSGAIEGLSIPLMLDTGANISLIHSNLARRLRVKVKMFEDPTRFYGVSEAPMKAHGKTTVKIKLGTTVVYEMELWVADFEAHSFVILGTDFMLRAGLRVDLGSKECTLPGEGEIPLLTYEQLKSTRYRDAYADIDGAASWKLNWASVTAVADVQDTPPAVFSVDAVDLKTIDQSDLCQEEYLHEGVEMSAEAMMEQLALIPEVEPTPTEPPDMTTADIGGETEEERVKMLKILQANAHLFISSGNALPPPAKGVVCDVDVGGAEPIAQRARRVPVHLLEKLYELLRGLLRAGLIRYSRSSWASPIVIVLKKNKKDIRLCIDYRLVNALTKLVVYSMPLIDDLLDNFYSVMWLVSLDNASGYWAIPLTQRARSITAFICPLGHFEWLRMPQGLKNAPQIYQRIIDNALWSMVKRVRDDGESVRLIGMSKDEIDALEGKRDEELLSTDVQLHEDVFHVGVPESEDKTPVIGRRSYIDDVTFGASSWDELCEMLERLLQSFEYWGITISLSKSAFGKKSVEFLSHVMTREGCRSTPRNLSSILDMKFPSTQKGVQKFIGSLVYYHRFIDNFATYAASLYELTDVKLRDGSQLEHAKTAFEILKQKLSAAPMLRYLERNRELFVILYTNRWAFGAAVCQEHDGLLHPVRFVSKVFKDAECRYTPAEQEVLALIKTLDAASHYLFGQEVTVFARYSTMKWLFTSKSLSGRAIQWAVMLSPWSLRIRRSEDTPVGLLGLLAASIAPPEKLDELLDDIAPMKSLKEVPNIRPMPELRRSSTGFVLTFDGAVKMKSPRFGSFGMILWSLPGWEVVEARYGVEENLTVNESEYRGLIGALELAISREVDEAVVCGDSRIVLGQVNGDLRCNQPTLQVWLSRTQALLSSFRKISFVHVSRKFNQSADLLTRKAMQAQSAGEVSGDEERDALKLLNTLPELLYAACDEQEDVEHDQQREDLSIGEARVASVATISEARSAWASERDDELIRTQVMALRKRSRRQRKTTTDAAHKSATADTTLNVSEAMLENAQDERFARIAQAQRDDEWCSRLIRLLQGDDEAAESASALKKLLKIADAFILDARDVLYYAPSNRNIEENPPRLVVPTAIKDDILHAYHTELGAGAHQGVGRVFERLRRLFYWRGMYADVEWFVASCEDCASAKGKPRYKGRSSGNIVATRPFQVLAMDFALPLPESHSGNKAMLCFICVFTGFIILMPMADTSASSVAEAYLAGVFKRFGASEVLRHDRDPRFMSSVFRKFNRMMKQRQRPTLAYRPQANGKQERSIQTVVKAIKCYISDTEQKDWDEYVQQLELALNTSVSLQHKQTSFYLVHGWNARTQLEATIPPKNGSQQETEALKWRQQVCQLHEKAMAHAHFIQNELMKRRAENHNESASANLASTVRREYQQGELVWLYHDLVKPGLVRKLAHLWHGPYEIQERVNESVYRLKLEAQDARIFPLVHISRLKPYVSRIRRPRERREVDQTIAFDEALLPEDSWIDENEAHDEREYEVEDILDVRYKQRLRNGRRRKEYLIKWIGYADPTWEDEDNLSCTALLYEFDARHAWQNRRKAAQTQEENDAESISEDDE